MRCGAVDAVWYPGARTSSTYWCFGGAPKKTPVSGLVGAHPLVALVVADGELDLAYPLAHLVEWWQLLLGGRNMALAERSAAQEVLDPAIRDLSFWTGASPEKAVVFCTLSAASLMTA